MDRIIAITRHPEERYLDFCVGSDQAHLYRWYERTGYLYRIKTLAPGSRDPLRGRRRKLVKACAEQAFAAKLKNVFFDSQFRRR